MTSRALGNLPDPPSPHDHDAEQRLRLVTFIPPKFSNRDLVKILDQMQIGSCTCNAAVQALRAAQIVAGAPPTTPFGSRLFAYWFARATEHTTSEDSGTYLRAVFEILTKLGFPPESVWPYVDDGKTFKRMPNMLAMRAAFDQKTDTGYQRITTTGAARVTDVKRALAARHLVCFGTDVTEDFCEGKTDPTRPLGPPTSKDKIAGGHAMAIAEYDGDVFGVPNSWGIGWGDRGWWKMGADYVAADCTRDLWIVESAPIYSEKAA